MLTEEVALSDKRQGDVLPNQAIAASSPRRSGRARISTTIQIGGDAVLRQNNYTVTGSDYIYHAEDTTTNTDADQNDDHGSHKKKAAGSPRQKKAKMWHHAPNPARIARRNHNQGVRAAAEPKLPFRWSFLAENRRRLEPFCEERVLQATMACDGLSTHKQPYVHAEVGAPKMIRATLRDYQLRGLNFMVKVSGAVLSRFYYFIFQHIIHLTELPSD